MLIGCVGMATLDTLLFVPERGLYHDAVVPVEEAIRCPGGKGMVTAVAMREGGGEVAPFSLLGRDSELEEMLPEGLDRRYCLRLLDQDSRTWINVSHAQKVITFVSREDLSREREGAANDAIAELVAEVDALYLTVEDPRILRSTLDLAHAQRIPIALNASIPLLGLLLQTDPKLLVDLVADSSLIFCNHMEDPQFLQALGVSDWSAVPAAAGREVIVTEGKTGGRFSSGESERWTRFEAVPPDSVRCVVGAGDTFNGAYLIARWADGASMAESCRRGAELASRKVAVRSSMLQTGQPTSAS